jgi:radical SAM protein with 4Fe4S-binding SPASM domain
MSITDDFIENPPFPTFTQFETSTVCNAKCLMCPHPKMKRRGTAKWSTINKVIREAAPKSGSMCPFLMQEPMLEPRLHSILANIKQNNPCCNIVVYSNMSVLHGDFERIIKDDLLAELHISFYGPTKELYAKWQPPLNWEKTQENIRQVKRWKQKYGKARPVTFLHVITVPELVNSFKDYEIVKDQSVDQAVLVPFDTFHGDIEDYAGDQAKYLGVPAERSPCMRLWTGLNVHFDGTVVPCCIDYNEMVKLGNVNTQSLEEIWNSEPFRLMRLKHAQGKWGEIPLCSDCKVHESQFSKEWREYWKNKDCLTVTC